VGVHVIAPGTICLVVRPEDDDGDEHQFYGRTTTVQGRLTPLCKNCGSVQYITDLRWPDGWQLVGIHTMYILRKILRAKRFPRFAKLNVWIALLPIKEHKINT
jgi:hypothetical protein